MKKIQSALYTLIIICFSSCEKDANVKLPKVEEKLTIGCAISPQDSIVIADVSWSQPIFNTSPTNDPHPPVSNATVIISSGISAWTLSYDTYSKKYVIDTTLLKIRAGMTFNLSVSTPDGKFVKAQTTIPYQNNTLSYTTTPIPNTANDFKLHATWSDPENTTDYYEFIVRYKYSGNYYTHRSDFLTDEGNAGGSFKIDWEIPYNPTTYEAVYTGVYTLSPELYKYYERLQRVKNSSGPFSEPIPMYSNIEGGFGIFGGFNKYTLKVLP